MKIKKFKKWVTFFLFVAVSNICCEKSFALFGLLGGVGGEVIILGKILSQTISQVSLMQNALSKTAQTVSILEEMNRGVKDVLRIAETAHIPLPPQVYEQAKQIDKATREAARVYGTVKSHAPLHTRTHYKSRVEGLFLSQDAFEFSGHLDEEGRKIKKASLLASQPAATRLAAGTLGVLVHAVSHTNRLKAKELEITSSERIEKSTKESARFNSFLESHDSFEKDMREASFSSLNSLGSSSVAGNNDDST